MTEEGGRDDGVDGKGKEDGEGDGPYDRRAMVVEATPRSPAFTAFDRVSYNLGRDGDASEAVAWLMTTLLGTVRTLKGVPYRVVRSLGAGSSAIVFYATELETGRKRALKVFHSVCPPNWPDIEFHNACMFAGHGNTIVPVCIAGLETERGVACCIVTEYYGGGDLFEETRAEGVGGLGEERAFRLFCQVLSVLFFMHERNMVHKDIKLENLVLEERGGDRLRVVDFGYAQRYVGKGPCDDDARYEERDRSRSGSPHYCPYEAFSGDAHHPTEPDMWAAFVCLYAMASGTLPFDTPDVNRGRGHQRQRRDDNDVEMAHASTLREQVRLSMVIREAKLPRPRRRNGEFVVGDELWSFLCAGLHHDRAFRLKTRERIVREPWVVSMTARLFPQLSQQPGASTEPVDPFLSSEQLSSFRDRSHGAPSQPGTRGCVFHKSISLTRVIARQQQRHGHCAVPIEHDRRDRSPGDEPSDRCDRDSSSWTLSSLTPISAKSNDAEAADGRVEWGEDVVGDVDGAPSASKKQHPSSWFSCFSFACRDKDE